MLVLEIEWLTGVCRAAHHPASRAPDWPPQADRIFSALVASWGARGESPEERAALEWLEGQEPPRIASTRAVPRTTVTSYVPPNDDKSTAKSLNVLPDRRRRQARTFPAVTLETSGSPHLELIWPDAAAPAFDQLQALARDTSYIGHSASVVRCRFIDKDVDLRHSEPCERAPYRGRLAELEQLHHRHMRAGDENAKPRPAQRVRVGLHQDLEHARPDLRLGCNWTALSHAGGERPELRAFPMIARKVREGLIRAYPDPVPEWLSGHSVDGAPTKSPHLAIVPLANVGWKWSDGSLMGFALILPAALEQRWQRPDPAYFERQQHWRDAVRNHRIRDLTLPQIGTWHLRRPDGTVPKSLESNRYCRSACRWSTVTPIALDRHPKANKAEEAEETASIIAQSCRNAGLPEPLNVYPHKHAAIQGAPSARPPSGAPPWEHWKRPKALASRPLVHATLLFREPVVGPIILGAGRFFGLGLCLAVEEQE